MAFFYISDPVYAERKVAESVEVLTEPRGLVISGSTTVYTPSVWGTAVEELGLASEIFGDIPVDILGAPRACSSGTNGNMPSLY